MQLLITYLLKLAFCLALGYLFYFLLLRRMTWYTWNRYFLLFFPLLALAIPLLPVNLPRDIQTLNAVFFVTDALPSVDRIVSAGEAKQGTGWDLNRAVLVTIFLGMLFFLIRFAIRFYSLKKTSAGARLVNNGDVKLFHLEGCTAPFSFYNSIYLDTNNYGQADLEKIIEHELVHIEQKHTLDMLVSEILCIVQWFNPFVWLMKHAIKQNLEFIADDSVLQKGINRKGYQYLLLKVSGAVPNSLANNLLFPSLKKRIHMMNRTKTRKIHLLKFMCILPLGCLLLFAFSGQSGKPPLRNNTADAFSLSGLSFYINDAAVAQLIEKEQSKSLLKEGGPLNLSLISEEKTRLKTLLEKNGYDTSGGRAISFVMDTSITNKSFSVKVVIDLAKSPVKNPQPAVNDKRPAIRVGNPAMDVHLEKDNLVIVPNVKPAVRLGNKLVVIPAPGK
jgi:beta-lactamase regulating signal transducer with metallopeptidase domain